MHACVCVCLCVYAYILYQRNCVCVYWCLCLCVRVCAFERVCVSEHPRAQRVRDVCVAMQTSDKMAFGDLSETDEILRELQLCSKNTIKRTIAITRLYITLSMHFSYHSSSNNTIHSSYHGTGLIKQ